MESTIYSNNIKISQIIDYEISLAEMDQNLVND